MTQAEDLRNFTEDMKRELGIITGESLADIEPGKNFVVRIPAGEISADNLNISECKCGVSYSDFGKWSSCEGVESSDGHVDLTFTGGEWRNDCVPCMTDLYVSIAEKSGRKFAASVRTNVRG